MLESEENLRTALKDAGSLATGKCLEHFDTDGAALTVGGERFTSKGRLPKVSPITSKCTTLGRIKVHHLEAWFL